MKYCLSVITLFALLSFSSCDDLTGAATGANDFSFSEIIGGSGAIVVADQRFLLEGQATNGVSSKALFNLTFDLPEAESLTFHFYALRDLSGGVNVTFSRTNGKLFMTMQLGSTSHRHEFEEFENVEQVSLRIDIHNDHPNVHNLIWNDSQAINADGECVFDDTNPCLYNTESFALDDDFNPLWSNSGKASGTFWGVTGNSDLIIKAEGYLPALTNV